MKYLTKFLLCGLLLSINAVPLLAQKGPEDKAGWKLGMHFKDVKKDTPDRDAGAGKYHDVVWGTGDCKIEQVIAELKRQRFKGPISAEYEYHWENNGPEIAESVKNFREIYNRVKVQ